MTEQPTLFPPGKPLAPLQPLTARQRAIYQLICRQPESLTPIELGALLHEQSGRHPSGEYCEWCGQDGGRALREKAIRQRVIRRADGVYEPRNDADWTGRADRAPSSQLTELPGETFEDLFKRSNEAA